MIAFLRGTVQDCSEEALILEVNGVGFRILMAASALQQLQSGDAVLIYTYLAHKEEAMLLYGFLNQDDKALFSKIISVSGVGPKTGLAVLSFFSATEFCQAIFNEDGKLLSKVPGIGQKTAQRLILELKSTLAKALKQTPGSLASVSTPLPSADDAIAALEALGYERIVAFKAVQEVRAGNPHLDLQAVIKTALKMLMKE